MIGLVSVTRAGHAAAERLEEAWPDARRYRGPAAEALPRAFTECDAVVCYWDTHAGRGAGTQGELTFAHRLGRPVYLVCAMPTQEVSGWILGCATEVFSGFGEFREFMSNKSLAAMAVATFGNQGSL